MRPDVPQALQGPSQKRKMTTSDVRPPPIMPATASLCFAFVLSSVTEASSQQFSLLRLKTPNNVARLFSSGACPISADAWWPGRRSGLSVAPLAGESPMQGMQASQAQHTHRATDEFRMEWPCRRLEIEA